VYLTDGRSRKVAIGRNVITLKHTSPKYLAAAGRPAGTVMQAIRYLGKDADVSVADTVANRLASSDRRRLKRTVRVAPAWMRPTLSRIADANPATTDR
jgi:Family of unknown function (DUF6088)